MDGRLLILLFFGICTSNAFHTLIPDGKEAVYIYESTTSISTPSPVPTTSKFNLHGKLHLQRHGESIFAKLTNLTYELFNGPNDADYEIETIAIPDNLDDFGKGFRIDYTKTGLVGGITVGAEEKHFVVNVKKALAAILQLDAKASEGFGETFAFQTEEPTLYGSNKVWYNVRHGEAGCYVDVMQEPESGKDMHMHVLSNIEYAENVDVLRRDNQRYFKIVKDGDFKMESLSQTGGIYYNSFNGKAEFYSIHSNQSLVLESIKDVEEAIALDSPTSAIESLIYWEADLKGMESSFPDFTNGRRVMDNKLLVSNAAVLIEKLVNTIKHNTLDSEKPDFNKGQYIHILSRSLLFFDENMFNELEEKLKQEKNANEFLNVFYQLLREVGTHSSYNHVLKLKDYKNEENDNSLFNNMFANVKFPNKKLVEKMGDEILSWDPEKTEPEIYNGAILSFATLLHKAASRHDAYKHSNAELIEDYPDQKYYEKYVLKLVESLKKTDSYDLQILYMQALYNTKFNSIVKHLLPAVKGKWWKDSHLQMMAALAISPVVYKNEKLTFEIYWPFMTNPKTPTSLRIIAYYVIMKTKPNLQKLINIYWIMESEKNQQLYKFHYKYINEVSQSEFKESFTTNLRQILKYTRRPSFDVLTNYYNIDYYDKEHLYGEQLELVSIYSKHEHSLIITGSYGSNLNGLVANPCWFFLRIAGLHPDLLNELKIDTTGKDYLLTWDKFKKALFHLENKDNSKFTLIIATNDQATYTKTFDGKTIKDMLPILKKILLDFTTGSSEIETYFDRSKTIHLPTDTGYPVIFHEHVPNIDYNNIKITNKFHEGVLKLTLGLNSKGLRSALNGLAFYNPYLDIYQGVGKEISHESYLDVKFDVSYDTKQRLLEVSWEEPEDYESEDVYAERVYAFKMVYVDDEFNAGYLQKSCPKCKKIQEVSRGKDYQISKKIDLQYYNNLKGIKLKTAFDLEQPLPKELNPRIDVFIESGDITDIKDFIKLLLRTETFEELQPVDINYGSYIVWKRNPEIPVDNIKLAVQFSSEYKKGLNLLHPAVEHRVKIIYNARNGSETFKDLLIDGELIMDDGHLNGKYKVDFNITKPTNANKVIIEGGYNYKDDTLKSETYIIVPGETTKENPTLFLGIHAEKSEEQIKNLLEYTTCFETVKSPITNGKSTECYLEYDAFRNSTIKIKSAIPGVEKAVTKMVESLMGDGHPVDTIDGLQDNEVPISIQMPIQPMKPYELIVYRESYGLFFEIPKNIEKFADNMAYAGTFELLQIFGLINVCNIDQRRMKLINDIEQEIENEVGKDWVLYLGSSVHEGKFEIWMKSTGDNNMKIKIITGSNTFVLNPQDKKYSFTVDGTEMKPEQTTFANNWLHYAWVKNSEVVSIYVKNIGAHIIYNGYQANIEYPEVENVEWSGRCTKTIKS